MTISEQKPWMKFYDSEQIPSPESIDCGLAEYLFKNVDDMSAVALEFFGTTVTFSQFREQILATAEALYAYGVREGDIVSVCSVTTPEVAALFYAADMIGAILNMIDPRTATNGVHAYLAETKSRLVFTLDKAYPRVIKAAEETAVEKFVVISPKDSLKGFIKAAYTLKNRDKNVYSPETDMWNVFYEKGVLNSGKGVFPQYITDRPCVIMHTGGTTGTPKSVLLSARNMNAVAAQYSVYEYKKNESFLNIMPPFIAYGFVCGIHLPLVNQVRDIIIPSFDQEKVGRLVLKYKPNHMACVPSHYQAIIRDKKLRGKDLSFLKSAGCGGDSLPEGDEKKVNAFLHEHGSPYSISSGWGMTELSSSAATNMKDIHKDGTVGIPICMITVAVINPETDEEMPAGTEGELYVTGPNVMVGYYDNEPENEKIFVTRKDGRRWVRTGDIGFMDEDGFIHIRSRIKRIIIRHDGFKVFPIQIEDVISTCPDVEACSVVSGRDTLHAQGKLPFVFMTKKTDIPNAELIEKVRKLCKENLAEYVQPAAFYCLDKLPYTDIGKVDYLALEKMVEYSENA